MFSWGNANLHNRGRKTQPPSARCRGPVSRAENPSPLPLRTSLPNRLQRGCSPRHGLLQPFYQQGVVVARSWWCFSGSLLEARGGSGLPAGPPVGELAARNARSRHQETRGLAPSQVSSSGGEIPLGQGEVPTFFDPAPGPSLPPPLSEARAYETPQQRQIREAYEQDGEARKPRSCRGLVSEHKR